MIAATMSADGYWHKMHTTSHTLLTCDTTHALLLQLHNQ